MISGRFLQPHSAALLSEVIASDMQIKPASSRFKEGREAELTVWLV